MTRSTLLPTRPRWRPAVAAVGIAVAAFTASACGAEEGVGDTEIGDVEEDQEQEDD